MTSFTGYYSNIADGDLAGRTKTLDSIMALDVAIIIPGREPVSDKKDVLEMKNYLICFDKKARELAAVSNDVEYITSEIKKELPAERNWIFSFR